VEQNTKEIIRRGEGGRNIPLGTSAGAAKVPTVMVARLSKIIGETMVYLGCTRKAL